MGRPQTASDTNLHPARAALTVGIETGQRLRRVHVIGACEAAVGHVMAAAGADARLSGRRGHGGTAEAAR